MSKLAKKFIDIAGRILRKIPNVPGKHLYSKALLKPIVNGGDMECVLPIHSGDTKLICRLSDWIPWNVYLHGSYIVERSYEEFMLQIAEESSVIFDVGANIGYYTVQFSEISDGEIYAFEPMNYQHETLQKNLELNSLTNIHPVKKIVSNTNSLARIYFSGMENTAASSLVNKTDQYEEIQCITLDDFCKDNDIEEIDLIKIDVEGYELKALKGLQNMLKSQKISHLFIEIVEKHLNNAGTSAKEICDYLESHNYKAFSVKSGELQPYQPGSDESLVYFAASDKEMFTTPEEELMTI